MSQQRIHVEIRGDILGNLSVKGQGLGGRCVELDKAVEGQAAAMPRQFEGGFRIDAGQLGEHERPFGLFHKRGCLLASER